LHFLTLGSKQPGCPDLQLRGHQAEALDDAVGTVGQGIYGNEGASGFFKSTFVNVLRSGCSSLVLYDKLQQLSKNLLDFF